MKKNTLEKQKPSYYLGEAFESDENDAFLLHLQVLILLMVQNSNKLRKLRLVMNIQPFMVSWTLALSKMLGSPKPSTKGDLYKQQDQPFLSSPRSLYFVAAFQRLDKFMYPTGFSGSHYWRVQFLLSIFLCELSCGVFVRPKPH